MADRINHYRDELDAKRILQIRDITRLLPQACSDFLRSIAVSTSSLTRLAYAIDLNTFFSFLHDERIAFSNKSVKLMNDQDLEKLTRNDIIAYTEDDMDEELFVPSPYSRLYVSYVKAMIDYANEEYASYQLNQEQHAMDFRDFVDWVVREKKATSRAKVSRFRNVL